MVTKYVPGIKLRVYREYFRGNQIIEEETRQLISKVIKMAYDLQGRGIAAKRFDMDNIVITLPDKTAELIDEEAVKDPYKFYTNTLIDHFQ